MRATADRRNGKDGVVGAVFCLTPPGKVSDDQWRGQKGDENP
jgi:hypothetical protein